MNTVSLQSMIMQQNPITPVVGMKACKVFYTDRYPVTVVEITSKNEIGVKPNNYKVIDHFGEIYEVGEVNESAHLEAYTRRKNGRWVRKGESMNGVALALDTHNMRIDPSF